MEQTVSYLYHFLIGLTVLFYKVLKNLPHFPLLYILFKLVDIFFSCIGRFLEAE